MGILIAVTGKGGTGKTAVTALMLKCLIEEYMNRKNILVIDADPDANLAEELGVSYDVRKTIGYIATQFKKMVSEGRIPSGIDKSVLLESKVLEAVEEFDHFDLLVMWRTEGEGCYCFVNEVLSKALDWLIDGYDIVLMDCEAGLEHFNRRIFKEVDHLFIVVDGSKPSFETAKRIKDIVAEVRIRVSNMWIIGNRVPNTCIDVVRRRCNEIGIPLAGIIPPSNTVNEYYILGKPLIDLPSDDNVVKTVKDILLKVGLLGT